ncbi:DUF6660 family protein [Pedobacter chinensis]|uniref:DUF6660 family protein n=1 Tax=Pedobacter chinensis TaxID=2282421 RepID=UPI0037445550
MICTFAERMKFLIYLLSLCILSLSCITCEDIAELENSQIRISSVTIEKSNHAVDQDNCTPLCTCNCCGQPLVVNLSNSSFIFLNRLISNKQLTRYDNQFVSDYSKNIWQPPKLNSVFIE